MNCKLIRTNYSEYGIFGELYNEHGVKIATTLEHSYSIPIKDLDGGGGGGGVGAGGGGYCAKVAIGTYTCKRHAPNRLPYETFELQNVPDFQGQPVSGILIHIGNYNKDSIGCILLGKSRLKTDRNEMILNSKEIFAEFMDLQKDVLEFTLTIE